MRPQMRINRRTKLDKQKALPHIHGVCLITEGIYRRGSE